MKQSIQLGMIFYCCCTYVYLQYGYYQWHNVKLVGIRRKDREFIYPQVLGIRQHTLNSGMH